VRELCPHLVKKKEEVIRIVFRKVDCFHDNAPQRHIL